MILVILVAIGIFFILKNKKNPFELTLYGNIEIRQVDLSFQVAGQIDKMLKEEGDTVKKGELVATLDNKDYNANLTKADAEVSRTLALYNDAKSKYKRKAPLCSDNTVSQMECETLLNTKNRADSDYKAALANNQFTKNQLDYTKLYAPDDGIITVRAQEPGATVNKSHLFIL